MIITCWVVLVEQDSSYRESAEELISDIKVMLGTTIRGGESLITPSTYDTAWVARVPAIDGFSRPQFPQKRLAKSEFLLLIHVLFI